MADEFQSLLGALVEKEKPSVYVETGFMGGDSAKAVMAAMDKNGKGLCYSIEPFFDPKFENPRLRFIHGYSYDRMVQVFLETGAWDIFLHDSNHDVGCMTYELELAWHFTKPNGIIACDDYTWGTPEHKAWQNFTARHNAKEVHQLGSCQYIRKLDYEAIPVKDEAWARAKWELAAKISDDASVAYGANPIFSNMRKQMKTLCLTLHETPEREAFCRKHFAEMGVNAEFVYGFHAKTAGLKTENNYEVDNPGGGHNIGYHGVGIWASMIMMYQIMNQLPDEHVFLLEHDAKFDPDWKTRFDKSMQDVPKDFDFLFIGHCCSKDDPTKKHVKGEVWKVGRLYCNHACVIAKKCLPFVIKTLKQKCWSPVDIQLVNEVFPHLKVYAILPRAVHQFDTELRP